MRVKASPSSRALLNTPMTGMLRVLSAATLAGKVCTTTKNAQWQKIIGPAFFNQPTDDAVVSKAVNEELPPLFDYLESQITGDWLVGSQFSIADISIGTQFVNLRLAGVSVDAARWPKLARYIARVHERPSFKKLIEEDRAALGQSA